MRAAEGFQETTTGGNDEENDDGRRDRPGGDGRREPCRQCRRARRHQEVGQDPHRHRPRRAALRHDRRADEAGRPRRRGRRDAGQGLGPAVRARADHRCLAHPGPADRQGRPGDIEPVLHRRARQGDRLLAGLCGAAHRDRGAEVGERQEAGRPRRQDRRHRARHHPRYAAHQGRPQGHEAGALRGRCHRGPGLPERPGRHLLDRRDDRAAARQEEPGPPGRDQVRARQLQALRRRQEGRGAAAGRGQQVDPGQHQERQAERAQQEVLRRRPARPDHQAAAGPP